MGMVIMILLPLGAMAQRPVEVVDTEFSKGRLGHRQSVNLDDLVTFHGHRCDGLVMGYLGLQEALYRLYPDSVVDRTNTRIVSKPSPCLTDVAVYLTGGRYQFNTFYASKEALDGQLFIVQRIDNGQAIGVSLRPGVKPAAIDSMGRLAVQRKLAPCALNELRQREDRFSEDLLKAPPEALFILRALPDFVWNPPFEKVYRKSDILNKDQPACGDGEE